jgi:CheY-like chemotaxis protein
MREHRPPRQRPGHDDMGQPGREASNVRQRPRSASKKVDTVHCIPRTHEYSGPRPREPASGGRKARLMMGRKKNLVGPSEVDDNPLGAPEWASRGKRRVTREIEVTSAGDRPEAPRCLLVFDSYRVIADALQNLLEGPGRQVGKAYDGSEALRLTLALRPDVIFCDLHLPGPPSAYELSRIVRADPRLNHVHLVAITILDLPECEERALLSGFDAILLKPVHIEQIEALIQGW